MRCGNQYQVERERLDRARRKPPARDSAAPTAQSLRVPDIDEGHEFDDSSALLAEAETLIESLIASGRATEAEREQADFAERVAEAVAEKLGGLDLH